MFYMAESETSMCSSNRDEADAGCVAVPDHFHCQLRDRSVDVGICGKFGC